MAAGLGYKEFATGDVLTATDANGYLASQVVMVFASSSARSAAITSPQEGMMSYLKDSNSVQYYDGSAWNAVGGGTTPKVLQVLSTTKSDTFYSTSTTAVDITGLSVSITPSATTSKILVLVTITGNGQNASNGSMFKLVRGSTDIAMPTSPSNRSAGFGAIYVNDLAQQGATTTNYLDSPASTSSLTYKVQGFCTSGGSFVVNRSSTDTDNNSFVRSVSSITVMEISA